MQSQGLTLSHEAEVGPSTTCASTVESCVDPLRQDLEMGDLDKCGLYIDDSPSRMVALRKVYEGSTNVHNVPLGNDQVKFNVEEVRDADACIPVPNQVV